MDADESREIGTSLSPNHPSSPPPPHRKFNLTTPPYPGFWLPLLARTVAKVTGVTDYNIVQNNGARAAQVVPHVHFHIIPRPATKPEIKSRSWTMFGRGQRDDLDDEEGARIAGEMRRVLRGEIERVEGSKVKL